MSVFQDQRTVWTWEGYCQKTSKHCAWFELGLMTLCLKRKIGDAMSNVSKATKYKLDMSSVGYEIGHEGIWMVYDGLIIGIG